MPIASLLAHRYWFAAAFLWTVAIAVLCLVDLKSFPSKVNVVNADKIVHIVFHFGFTFLWCQALKRGGCFSHKKILMVVAISILYGIAIECAQEYLTVSRKASPEDVIANFTGSVAAGLLVRFGMRQHA